MKREDYETLGATRETCFLLWLLPIIAHSIALVFVAEHINSKKR